MVDVPLAKPRGGKRILLLAIVAALSATAVLAMGILLLGDFGEREGRILATTALLAAYGLLALPAGFLFDQRRLRGLATTVLVLAATGFSFAVATVWMGSPPDELGNTLATITSLAVACTQTAALAARRRAQDSKAVRRLFVASTALALSLAAMFTAAIWGEIDSSAYFRILAAFAVLDVLMVVLQPILALTRPVGAAYRLRVFVEPGEMIETTVEAPDLASAAARAIRTIEREGREVSGLERASAPARSLHGVASTADKIERARLSFGPARDLAPTPAKSPALREDQHPGLHPAASPRLVTRSSQVIGEGPDRGSGGPRIRKRPQDDRGARRCADQGRLAKLPSIL